MRRPLLHQLALTAPLFLLACGGAKPEPAATGAGGGRSSSGAGSDPSIGEAMVQEGGSSALASAASASAGSAPLSGSLRAELVPKDQKVKLDGVPLEWPARTAATTTVKGTPRVKLAGAIQYDDAKIYVAGEITDPGFVAGRSQASLVLAFPSGGGALSAYDIALAPGKPGESEGSVKLKGAPVAGAKIVEAPTDGGLSFEAAIPWATFPEAARLRVGLRGVLRYADATGAIIATGNGDAADPKRLPSLPTEAEQGLIEGLVQPKGLAHDVPKFELYADVAGDAQKERITVWGSYFTICGPGYRDGREFFFRDLGAELVELAARELTGRGKSDIVVRRRYPTKTGARENFEVWSILGASGEPVTTFAHEILVQDGAKKVANTVHVGAKEIDVAVMPAAGWDVVSYHEPVATDVEPVLLPWGAVKSRTFRFDGVRFSKANEVAQTPTAPPASVTAVPSAPADPRVAPPTPREKKGGDVGKALFEQIKKERGVAEGTKPKLDVEVQVDGDARPERLVAFGRDLIVFGPGFKGGTGYAYLTMSQFEADGDVREVTSRDLNGDGAADIVVRGVRHVRAQGATGPVEMDTLFVYSVKDGAIQRVFGIETAREIGAKRVQGLVQFVPAKGGKSFEIDVRPGRAVGWNEKSYPWGQEQPGTGAVEPLLLPWGGISSLRYAWDGSRFSVTK
ncbi:MAG: hypothetical protein U0235_21480 [Polyangiaceae bacterium]